MTAVTEHEISLVPATDHSPTIISLNANDFPVPTGREEQWRFTPLKRLAGLHEAATPAGQAIQVSVTGANGFVVDTASKSDRAGFTDRVSAVAWSQTESVVQVTVPKNAELAEPALVTITGLDGYQYGQVDIKAESFSKSVVIINHVGAGNNAINVDIHAGDGA
ncbi:MAG: hypothetical protein KGQ38_05840, partial [Actinomycetales bacterium]|nr:hypothetical protein [Actinomycetales bacterium]